MVKKQQSGKNKYFLFVVVAFFSFGFMYVFFKPEIIPECANSITCTPPIAQKIENNVPGVFAGKRVNPPLVDLTQDESTAVLGVASASGEKHIYIDLSKQTLIAYQGKTEVLKTLVSTGKWGRTPAGNFNIWHKNRVQRMTGGQGTDYYDLPNVQYVQFFFRDFALHQAYWHNNFGHEMSHGCINLRLIDAKILYEWADGPEGKTKGTPVSVCDEITEDNQCVQNNPVN